MINEKRIKVLIIILLLLTETFVWTINGSNDSWSIGMIGGADGPTSIFIGGNGRNPKEEKPSGAQVPDQSTGEKDGQPAEEDNQLENDEYRQQSLKEAKEKGLLVLVNKEHPIDRDYKPDDLEKIKYFVSNRSAASRYMRAEAAAAFHQMVDKAAEENIELRMTTAYRSYDFQKLLYENYVEKEGEAAANKYSAKPGQSEHQTGLAVDVSSPSVEYQLSADYDKTQEGKWLAGNAYRFGFIIRFPLGKEDVTGYQYEPWHIRYVGLTAAREIYKENLTLEEFLQKNDME